MNLDTTFLVDVLRGRDAVEERMRTLDESGRRRVSAITTMELWEGIHLADSSERERSTVKELLDGLDELPFDRDCAIEAGTISADLQLDGNTIETPDVQIAATARVHDEPVVTANTQHFERIDDVRVIEY